MDSGVFEKIQLAALLVIQNRPRFGGGLVGRMAISVRMVPSPSDLSIKSLPLIAPISHGVPQPELLNNVMTQIRYCATL
jgi:hypothetical protein